MIPSRSSQLDPRTIGIISTITATPFWTRNPPTSRPISRWFPAAWIATDIGTRLMAQAGFGARTKKPDGDPIIGVTGPGWTPMVGPGLAATHGGGRPTTTERGDITDLDGAGPLAQPCSIGARPESISSSRTAM